jgi:hypothetical protein
MLKGVGSEPAYIINCQTELYNYQNPIENRIDPDDPPYFA